MSTKLIMAIITITLALVFYTIGVFSERKSGILKKPHLILKMKRDSRRSLSFSLKKQIWIYNILI